MLPTGAGGAVDLHLNVLRPQLDIGGLHLRQDGHRRRRRMDAAAGFRLRDALDPVDAGFEFQPGVGPGAADEEVGFLDTAQLRLGVVEQLQLPAPGGGVHGVHPEKAVGKQGALLAADADADLHQDIFLVVRIPRQEQELELLLQFLAARFVFLIFLLAQGFERLVLLPGHHGKGVVHILRAGAPGAVGGDDGLQLPLLLEEFGSAGRVSVEIRLLGPGGELEVFIFQLLKFLQHGLAPLRRGTGGRPPGPCPLKFLARRRLQPRPW